MEATKQQVYEKVAQTMNQKGVRFLLARTFLTADDIQQSFRTFREEANVLAVFKSEHFDGYTVLVVKGVPNFVQLPKLGLHPVRKDSANWIPRIDQDGRNAGNYEAGDNYPWMYFDELLEMIRKDEDIALIYK